MSNDNSSKNNKPGPKKINAEIDKSTVDSNKSMNVKNLSLKDSLDLINASMRMQNGPIKAAYDYSNILNLGENYKKAVIANEAFINSQKIISSWSNWSPILKPTITSEMQLETEIAELKIKLSNTIKDNERNSKSKEEKIQEYNELSELHNALKAKEKISHVITRVNEQARIKLLHSPDFLLEFNDSRSCDAVVVSIDIRRSTELMLKARTPQLFSKFITELSLKLSNIIIENYGIFDKFTGDGILAFFPKFYSGDQAILRALKAAEECHEIFAEHYNLNKKSFSVFITNIGLGIGIDYGNVTLVNTTNELTVVGIPVVYACRMSSAKAGDTVLNIPAYEELENIYPNQELNFDEVIIDIKNEGLAQAYKVESKNNKGLFNAITEPIWLEDKIEEAYEEVIDENKEVSENLVKIKNPSQEETAEDISTK